MGQSTANQWIHVLLPMLLAALRAFGDAPTRSLTALAQRLGVSEADAATVVVLLEEEPAPVIAVLAAAPMSYGKKYPLGQCPAHHPLAQ
jgi:hypothetical protein